ncbi:hypothetical protein [Enterococcus faecium]|uniref:hypothetical protein n=1 Tax=Enterococcus faecium TaxID=1352 RepID=UPI002FDC443B
MIEREEAEEIMKKYNRSYGEFEEKATRKEFMTVLQWVAEESNRKQRKIVGLDKEEEQ